MTNQWVTASAALDNGGGKKVMRRTSDVGGLRTRASRWWWDASKGLGGTRTKAAS